MSGKWKLYCYNFGEKKKKQPLSNLGGSSIKYIEPNWWFCKAAAKESVCV